MNANLDNPSGSLIESRVAAQWLPAARIAGLLFLFLTAGCAKVERAPPQGGTAVETPLTRSTDQSVAKTPAKIPAPATAVEQTRKKEALPPLDLATLEKRLKETKAIGVFTKLTLKNQVDDLLEKFRAHYQGRIKTSLAELRLPYDMLLLKVLSLLQDGDPALARMVVASREAIWGILADPAKFATI